MAKTKKIILADSGVIYDPVAHDYHLNGKELKGITGTLVNRAYPKDKTYANVSEEVLNHAAERGSACHQAVGNYYTVGISSTGYESIAEESKRLLESQGLTPIRFEYVVTDFEHYASPIDIVCVNKKNEICIVDMKFTAKLLHEQVALQTSIYQRFFSLVNPKLQAKHLYVLWIHTNDSLEVLKSGIYELTPAEDSFIDELMAADIADKTFDITKYYGDIPAVVNKVEDYLVNLIKEVGTKTEELNNIKDGLCRLMVKSSVKQYDTFRLKLTKVSPAPRVTFDSASFKEDYPDLYQKYCKESAASPFIRITVKDE